MESQPPQNNQVSNQNDLVATYTPSQTMIDLTSSIQLSESSDAVYHYFVASPLYAGFGDLGSPERIYFLDDYGKMPPALKNFMASPDTVELIFSIGKDLQLDDIQISELSVAIRELLTGKIFIQDFPMTVSSKLGIDDIKAGEIVNKIVSKSFGPILEDIKRIQRSKFPDKVSAMQKAAQPAGLNPRPQAPEGLQNTPLTQPSARPDAPQNMRPPISQIPRPVPQSQPQSQMPPPRPAAPPPQPPPQASPRPPIQAPAVTPPLQSNQPKPADVPQSRPQFKMPDIGQPFSSPRTYQEQPAQTKPMGTVGQTPIQKPIDASKNPSPGMGQKSLEDELEKVANVIDLRAKSKEE